MIDLKTLKQLIRLMTDNDLSELDLRDKDEQVTLKRGGGAGHPVVMSAPQHAPPAPPPPPATEPGAPTAAAAEDAGHVKITSPMVGTFYAAPSREADPYVRAGSRVDPDTVVCIIEAMKVFNEIKAECSGTVSKVLVSNGQAVEFGQPLFLVKPD